MNPFPRPDEWSVSHNPVAATQATIGKPAVPNFRHVCTGFTVSVGAVATASGMLTAVLRDGVSGGGTILWAGKLSVPVNSCGDITVNGCSIPGSKNTAMTLEFSGAGAAASEEAVTMHGYSEAA